MTPVSLDPVVSDALAAAASLVLLFGAWAKLRAPGAFEGAVAQYRLLPDVLVQPVARALPLAEALAGCALLLAATRALGVVLALGVLALVTAAVAINLARGRRDIDCGCGGIEGRQRLSWALVARNGVLMAAVVLAAADPLARPLAWLDRVALAGATLALFGTYAAVSRLIANRPLLAQLRSQR